jgi:hypothetical protein
MIIIIIPYGNTDMKMFMCLNDLYVSSPNNSAEHIIVKTTDMILLCILMKPFQFIEKKLPTPAAVMTV